MKRRGRVCLSKKKGLQNVVLTLGACFTPEARMLSTCMLRNCCINTSCPPPKIRVLVCLYVIIPILFSSPVWLIMWITFIRCGLLADFPGTFCLIYFFGDCQFNHSPPPLPPPSQTAPPMGLCSIHRPLRSTRNSWMLESTLDIRYRL